MSFLIYTGINRFTKEAEESKNWEEADGTK